MNRTLLPSLAAVIVFAAACSGDPADDAATDAPAAAPAAPASAAAPALPDTTADAVWAMLTEAAYQENWTLWPGFAEYYTGNEPHGMLLTTYLNDVALAALEAQAGTMPVGAVVVKDNFMPDSTLAATTVMVKRPVEYNPDFNGWYWLKRNADGSVDVDGRGAGCQACHGGRAAANDFLVTGPLSGGQP